MVRRSTFLVLFLPLLSLATVQDTKRDVMVYEQYSNQWFEGAWTRVAISVDADWMLLTAFSGGVRLVSLKTGREDRQRLSVGLDSPAESAVFCGAGKLVVRGTREATRGWFHSAGQRPQTVSVPADAELLCSPDGKRMAYYLPKLPKAGLFVGTAEKFENYPVQGKVSGMVFSPDGKALYALLYQPNGASSLTRITLQKPSTETIARGLDAIPAADEVPGANHLAISPNGRSIFLALATDAAPDNAMRHKPDTQRWLKVYQLDLASGKRRLVVESDNQDNFNPGFAAGDLYWSRNVVRESIALLPVDGGETKELVPDGELPIWSPDGRRISYVFGGWRLADWAINLDAAVVDVDAHGQRASSPRIIVSGYHEDFPAAWSPNGRWIAFHSHRSKTPVPAYDSPGSTDDVYIRLADDLRAPEIRVTDFGWQTGPPFWSPDGRRLMFSSWVKNGQPGIYKVSLVTLDPDSGKVLRIDQLPLPPDIHSAQSTAWSPDGKEIAIEDDRGGENRSLWIVDADGAHGQKLVDYKGSTYGGVDWTLDGKTIIYAALAEDRMQLFGIPRHGASPNQLSHDLLGSLLHPRVSPDGRWVACTLIIQSLQIWRRTSGRHESEGGPEQFLRTPPSN
jgi:Tol biopolymer transport system component